MSINDFEKIVFFGGGILAEKLYKQIPDIESKLVGVVDLLDDNARFAKLFKNHKIVNAHDSKDVLNSPDVAVMVAIGHFGVYRIVEDFVSEFPNLEKRLFVVNPYSSLRHLLVSYPTYVLLFAMWQYSSLSY